MVSEKVHLFWLRSGSKSPVSKNALRLGSGEPVTLVAYRHDSDGSIVFATATKSPRDKFNRKTAHKVVANNIRCFPVRVVLDNSIGPQATIASFIISTCRGREDLPPRRIYEAAVSSYGELVCRHSHAKRRQKRAIEKEAAELLAATVATTVS